MIGMNDVNRELYRKQQANDSLKQKALAVYRRNTEQAMINLKKKPIGLILLKPSIYDQTSTIPTENFYGVNDALQQCAKHIEYLSKEYKTGLVDMQSVMLGINSVEQLKNPAFTIVGKDRVHPASPGHFVMAYQFLKDTKAPKYVSKIVIDPGHASLSLKSANCSIKNLKRNRESISFSCLENSLPFPVRDSAKIALNWIPFNEEFNKELLQVDLPRGTYDLFIDDRKITSCSSTLFKKGINLADYPITPQYLQALTVLKACAAYREKESIIRNLRFIEFTQLAEWKGGNDTTALRNYLGRKLENLRNGGHYNYYKTQFNKYFINRIKEKETQLELDALAGEIYMLNQPKVHLFRIEKQRKQITKA
jgi:endoglucanase